MDLSIHYPKFWCRTHGYLKKETVRQKCKPRKCKRLIYVG